MSGLARVLSRVLAPLGLSVRRTPRPDGRHSRSSAAPSDDAALAAKEVLRRDSDFLQSLKAEYAALDLPVMVRSKWGDGRIETDLELSAFRGDNVYVWQYRQYPDQARLRFFLSSLDARSQDDLGLLERLSEDGAFGCWTFVFSDGRPLSRDLLDSVIELNYLERRLGISSRPGLRILDIGAGYGRLAHRACESFPQITAYDCVDAIPESTFLCDFYLNHRGLSGRARSVPMHRLGELHDTYDVAVNIHSFSESPRVAVRWWLELLRDRAVPYLLIVPNDSGAFLTSEPDGSKQDFLPDVREFGYELVDSRPVYSDSDLREFIGVEDRMHLFALRAA